MKSNKEILERAITLAIGGGWKVPYSDDFPLSWDWDTDHWFFGQDWESLQIVYMSEIIFNHDFAKALWGDKPKVLIANIDQPLVDRLNISLYVSKQPAFEYHLQQMVIADDPIKYLGENI